MYYIKYYIVSLLVSLDAVWQWITIFRNSDIPEFTAGIGRTRYPAWTSSVVSCSVWIQIIHISPCSTELFTDTPELPARRCIICRTSISTGRCQSTVPTVVRIGKWVLSIISGVDSLPGVYRSYSWFRLLRCHALRFTAFL